MKQIITCQGVTFPIELAASGGTRRITLEGQTRQVQVLRAEDGQLDLLIDGQPVRATVTSDGPRRWVTVNGRTLLLTLSGGRPRAGRGDTGSSSGRLLSPMPGQVRAVQATPGQAVEKGQTLLVIEAMKMEMRVTAPFAGVVLALPVSVGQTVDRDQLLAEIGPAAPA